MNNLTGPEAHELLALFGRADVIVRTIGERRAARGDGAHVDVLTALPQGRYALVAGLKEAHGDAVATAIVYLDARHTTAPGLENVPDAVDALLPVAREHGADAIVLHGRSP